MEIPGDVFKPFFGLVNQTTQAPIGRLIPWKMSRMTLDLAPDKVDTPSNAFPDFASAIRAKRRATGTVHNASFDPAFNIFNNANPFALPFNIHDGLLIRAMMDPDTSAPNLAGIAGERMGVPILGAGLELPAAVPATAYVFMCLRVMRVRHEADAAAGQPFDFDVESVSLFACPGEQLTVAALYGFSPVVGLGGFL